MARTLLVTEQMVYNRRHCQIRSTYNEFVTLRNKEEQVCSTTSNMAFRLYHIIVPHADCERTIVFAKYKFLNDEMMKVTAYPTESAEFATSTTEVRSIPG